MGKVSGWWVVALVAVMSFQIANIIQHKIILSDCKATLEEHSKRHRILQDYIQLHNRTLGPEYISTLATHYISVGKEYSIDPFLLAALGHHESSFDRKAVSDKGAVGIMQVMPFWVDSISFLDKVDDLLDPLTNIRAGAYILRHYMDRCGGIEPGLMCYYGGTRTLKEPTPSVVQYKNLVLNKYSKMELI